MKVKNYVIPILLLGIALILTFTAIVIHSLNSQMAHLLWGTSLGGLADIDRYLHWEWIARTCLLASIPFYAFALSVLVYLETLEGKGNEKNYPICL